MSFLRFSQVTFGYGGVLDIFADVSFQLDEGWTGVVGANGGGKTTLLELVAGRLQPELGSIQVSPAGAIIHTCAQRVDHSDGIDELGWAWDRAAVRLRGRLELETEEIERWPTLSPGERKRWQIGAALYRRPDVLLLDEPTNHLDSRARLLLIGALRRFGGVGVIVSHDRELLDALTTRTLRVQDQQVRAYRGSYSAAREQWTAEAEQRVRSHQAARSRERALRKRLADARRDRASAQAKISTGARSKGAKDSDARTATAKNRVMFGEARLSRQVSKLRRSVGRAESEASSIEVTRQRGRSLFVDYEPAPMSPLVVLDESELRAGELVVARDVRVAIERASRVHLAGDNGAGKTTLLHALLGAAGDRASRFLYLPQELPRERGAQELEAVAMAPAALRARTLDIVAALGADPGRLMASAMPSPGELRKLVLARGMAESAWALFLDEPSNHLDLPSVERIEEALADYPGALLVVSHDARLAAALTSERWRIGDGRVQLERC